MSLREADALVASANVLYDAAQAGLPRLLLFGKNLGLLCESELDEDAVRFAAAAGELGAQVAHIRPSLTPWSERADVLHTARMLGRLYDGVECQGLAPALVRQMGRDAGVPFFDGIASRDHPTAQLADLLNGNAPLEERRRYVVQAILLGAIG